MRRIPAKLRAELAADPFMFQCIHRLRPGSTPCDGRIEWDHVWLYANKQINERWAIIPVCTYHHRHGGLDKNLNRYASILRMTEQELTEAKRKYPRTDWEQMRKWLASNVPDFRIPSFTNHVAYGSRA